jgi:hypothetical protein
MEATMTAKELSFNIGKRGFLDVNGMEFHVEIRDARQVFNRVDYRVTPVDGNGNSWVESSRVKAVK